VATSPVLFFATEEGIVSLFTRRAAGVETTVTVSSPSSQFLNYTVLGLKGTDATTPIEVGAFTTAASGATANCPTETTLTNNAAIVALTVQESGGGVGGVSAEPAGMTGIANFLDTSGAIQNRQSWKLQAVAGSTGTLTWTYGNHTPLGTLPIATGTVVLRASGELPVSHPKGGAAAIFAVAAMGKGLRLGLGQSKGGTKGGGQGKGQGSGQGGGQHPPPQPPPGPPPPGSTRARRKAASDIRRRRGV
jgi:hypothetical protein